jgi:hypothetical protein
MTYRLSLTADDLRQLAAVRRRRFVADRRQRAQAISRSKYRRLGTDNATLLLREIAYASAKTKAEHSGQASRFASWCQARAKHDDARECRAASANDLTEAKAWALRFIALSANGEQLTRSAEALTTRAEVSEIASHETSDELPTRLAEPLAFHLSAQAPPKQTATAVIRGAASAFQLSQRKAVKN